jgi:glutaredoxin 3
MRLVSVFVLVLCLAAEASCRKSAPEVPPAQNRELPRLEVERKGTWLFTYADDSGRFVTTDDIESVPAASRGLVRVTDPARAADQRREGVAVYVVDLHELARRDKVQARVLSREAFETGAMAQLAPGASSVLPSPGAPSAQGAPPAPDGITGNPPAARAGPVVVTLYGTSWCSACKSARSYLQSRGIPFADKDVERDAAAARELREKAGRLGVQADRVPILDIRGRLLVGFDKDRLEALLGEAS